MGGRDRESHTECVYLCEHIYVCMYICTHIHIRIVCVCVCVCVCACVCVCVCTLCVSSKILVWIFSLSSFFICTRSLYPCEKTGALGAGEENGENYVPSAFTYFDAMGPTAKTMCLQTHLPAEP